MFLRTIGTGSSGNCHLLTASNGETLILDCGVPISEIKKGLDWNIKNVVGCVVTHQHIDHSKSLGDIANIGISIFAPYVYLGATQADKNKIITGTLGRFKIKAFQVPHNETRNCGFLMYADEQKFLYMTDYEYCLYNFAKQKINHMLIECNYIRDMVDRDIPNFEHKIRGHAELETVKKFVETNKSDALQNVILCHLGQDSSDKDRIADEIKEIVPTANVDVAEPNKEWVLRNPNVAPF